MRKNYTVKQIFALTSFLTILLVGFNRNTAQAQQCSCTNCPQFMPDGFTGNFFFQVENAANPILGQNGQGVCAVTLVFDHEYIGDLSITLTSPAGQSVQLVGPIGFFGPTDGTVWSITFLPCGETVSPDPGFNNQWSNNQAWGLNGVYNGSYYPASGCLENFNTGPVNGQWTLTVVDGQANDVGNFFDYVITFCDPDGINCFSCAANAGQLTQADITACQGSNNLVLNLPPTYTAPNVAPPPADYSYTYIISGPGGIIQEFSASPDLSGYDSGLYSVCGLSYLTSQAGDIPAPDGTLTVQQLTTQLNSNNPPFCGDITTNCVNVNILEVPQNVEEFQTICAPQCYTFYNQNYCQSGTYVRNLTQNGCPFTATLHLTVVPPITVNMSETICAGECSQIPGFESYCSPGTYFERFDSYLGCDSIVRLTITMLTPVAYIAPPPALACGVNSITLLGIGSSSGFGVAYQWTASNGGNITGSTTTINTTINTPGTYQLRVCRTSNGVQCCDSTEVTVIADQNPPAVPAGISGPDTLCFGQTATFTAALSPGAANYIWTLPPGVTVLTQSANQVEVLWATNTGGNVCVAANNSCGTSAQVCKPIVVNPLPLPGQPQGNVLVCAGSLEPYQINLIAGVSNYTWTVPPSGTIISGQGTNAILVNWSSGSGGNICVTATNTCGTSQQVCLPVQITNLPAIPVLSGDTLACQGSTSTYVVGNPANANGFEWTVSGGTIISGQGNDTLQVQWTGAGIQGSVCVRAYNACDTTDQQCLNVTLETAPPSPVVSGPVLLCAGASATYTINAVAGASAYNWTVPAGATILSGQGSTSILVQWGANGGDICVAPQSGCGAGPASCLTVSIQAIPIANAGADTLVCGFNAALNATLNLNGSTGTWSLISGPGLANISDPALPQTNVNTTLPGVYIFNWQESINGCSDVDSVQITFSQPPVAGTLNFSCDAANENFTVSFDISGGQPPYTVNGTIISGNTFVSASFANGQMFNFQIQDANNCVGVPVSGSSSCDCTSNAGAMNSALLEACAGDSVTATILTAPILDGNDTLSYILHSNSNNSPGQIFAQNHSGTFGFQNGMVYEQTYYISVAVGNNLNNFPDPNDPCFKIAAGQPVVFHAIPVADAGADITVCGNAAPLNAVLPANSSGSWSIVGSPAGSTPALSDPADPASNFNSSLSGVYTLVWTISTFGCSDPDTLEVVFNEFPQIVNIDRLCDAANENYTVIVEVGGGTAPYTANGQAFAGNTFTSAPFANGQPYNFQFSDANGCPAPVVSGSFLCNCTTDPGTLETQVLKACAGDSVSAQVLTAPQFDGNDIAVFVLHTNSGTTIGQELARNNSGTFGFMSGLMQYGQTYYISRVVGNNLNGQPDPTDPCYKVSVGQPVVFLEIPNPTVINDFDICGTSATLGVNSGSFNGSWTEVGGTTASITQANQAQSLVNVPGAGTYLFQWVAVNDICAGADTLAITFNEIPLLGAITETCSGTNTSYTIDFQVNGGTAPFTISGINGTFNGNSFTSAALPNGNIYTFNITDANGCAIPEVSGVKNCDCTTDAGSLNLLQNSFCEGDSAKAIWNNNGVLDADDDLYFVLHTNAGLSLGTVLARNTTPAFAFGPGLQTGVTYYISAIAGNLVGGSIDPADPCFSITQGIPVQWVPLPNASINGSATICRGSSTTLQISGSGVFPQTVWYRIGNGPEQSIVLNNAQGATLNVNPDITTTYQLIRVRNNNAPGCERLLNGSVVVTVSQPLNAGTALAPLAFCESSSTVVDLNSRITGASPGGVWTESSTLPSAGNAFNAANATFTPTAQAPGLYKFTYSVDAQAPCPDQSTSIEVQINPNPVADAGADKQLDCSQPSVVIGGNSSSGTGTTYQWTNGATNSGQEKTLTTSNPGTYTLVVSNSFGCSDSDAVLVKIDSTLPSALIKATGVRCFSDKNGKIELDSVRGLYPPVLISINGSAFTQTTTYFPLTPGNYEIRLQDAAGCEWSSGNILVAEPPKLEINLGNDFEISLGDSAIVQAQILPNTGVLDTIYWSPLMDSLRAGSTEQRFYPIKSVQITARAVDTAGCAASDRIWVSVDQMRHVYIPNIIDPSSTTNNLASIFGGNDVEEVELFRIYDRWGTLLFEARDFQADGIQASWDGTYKGKLLPTGVYAYMARIKFKDGERELFKGDITIYR